MEPFHLQPLLPGDAHPPKSLEHTLKGARRPPSLDLSSGTLTVIQQLGAPSDALGILVP